MNQLPYLLDEICAGVKIYFTGNTTTLNFRDPRRPIPAIDFTGR
jgi:hypothetical protein